ncbi:MAG: aconitate hydratase AcnA [SAR116 cluster bacterium]|jgi:aconitate hydratase|nr:aconitate hydratase AcnA [SAR116 cluster bacterium]RCL78162.1 MAG: aconitate hydratase AcnA [SAR116 cluster bacterium]
MTETLKDKCRQQLGVADQTYTYYSLPELAKTYPSIHKLPYSLKVLLENLLRNHDGDTVTDDDIIAVANWADNKGDANEIAFRPARVLMQDFTGVPAVVDLAAMRDAMSAIGGDPEKINPLSPVDLVIDHSVMVDYFGGGDSLEKNTQIEFERNAERYEFLRWGSKAFSNFRVVPPGTGICHQVNLEYLAQTVWTKQEGNMTVAYPDSVVGTDSHTTMVNGLSVLGWGVGGIEAESSMLGQPISMLVPDVIGFYLDGALPEGATATDLVLMIVQALRQKGVVGKFVEFYGPGVHELSLADRATIANMAPEYGATCGFFPIDGETINYLQLTGREEQRIALVEAYAKAQMMWHQPDDAPHFTDTLSLNLSTVVPSLAGPKRPQDRVELGNVAESFADTLVQTTKRDTPKSQMVESKDYNLTDGDVVIAAITSCTNTSNPSVLIAAGLLAKAANERGLTVKPWVKTSLAPGSQVVTDYLNAAGLSEHLNALGFNTVGYGCTTCIGNSGPLEPPLADAVEKGDLIVTSVLSGNRNFEGRISPHVAANYLASPPLVVAYALAGSVTKVVNQESLGTDKDGNEVFLSDIWPSNAAIRAELDAVVSRQLFQSRYADVFTGPAEWQQIQSTNSLTYNWDGDSTYVQNPPYFEGMTAEVPDAASDINQARILAVLGDSITTDHISPAGAIRKDSPAGDFLSERQISQHDFNSYGARRGNHEIMMRGTFANIRLKNEAASGTTGGYAVHIPSGDVAPIYDVAMRYAREQTPLVVVGGKEYGTGSSRDWAAKGTRLLGVSAVIVESFERIHRSNLIGMGVLPLQFTNGDTRETLKLSGSETVNIMGIADGVTPGKKLQATVTYEDGSEKQITLLARIDTAGEAEYFRHGGILHYVLRQLAAA